MERCINLDKRKINITDIHTTIVNICSKTGAKAVTFIQPKPKSFRFILTDTVMNGSFKDYRNIVLESIV